LLDLLKALIPESKQYSFEIYGNFLLQDVRTKDLSISHGYRCIKDLTLSSGFRDDADFSIAVRDSDDVRELAQGLIDGRYTRHFERIFTDSSRSIVSLLQVVVCVDTLTFGKTWHRPGKIYKARDAVKASS